jgi:hypothetical protein
VKNRAENPMCSGWTECLVNFTFRDDANEHVCESLLSPSW